MRIGTNLCTHGKAVPMPSKPKHPNPGKYPAEARKIDKEEAAEKAQMNELAKRPLKEGKISKGSRRRVG